MNKNGQSYDQYNSQQGQPNPDDMRYREPSFNQYCQDPAAPRSLQVFLLVALRNRIQSFVKNLPKMLLIMITFTVLTFVFNIFFWAVLNDTMWAGSGRLGSLSFMPYLIGGAVYSGSRYKGVTPFEIAGMTPTGKIVAPLTFALSMLLSLLLLRKKQAGSGAVSRDFASVKSLKEYYEKILGVASKPAPVNMNMAGNPNMPRTQNNPNTAYDPNNQNNAINEIVDFTNLANNVYMRIGLCCAFIFGFIIRNPFAIPLFGLILYLSFGQGGQSSLGQMIFRIRVADSRLYNGKKQKYPRFCEGMLAMYYMAVGLFLYSAVNVLLWFIFNYNFYIRFIVTGVLVAALIVLGTGGKKQFTGLMSSIFVILGGITMYYLRTVLADDGGITESGGTLVGLLHNGGFTKMAESSLLPGLSFDVGIFLLWPFHNPQLPLVNPAVPVSPVTPEYIPPQDPVSSNPYDFPGRPDGWDLNDEGDITYRDPVTGEKVKYELTGYDDEGKGIYIDKHGEYHKQDSLLDKYDRETRNLEYYKDVHETAERNLAGWRAKNEEERLKRAKELAMKNDQPNEPSDPVANDIKDKIEKFDKENPDDRPWGDDTDMIDKELERRDRFDYSNQNKQDFDRPEPDRPEPDRPEPDRPEPDRPEPDRPEPDRPEPDRPEPDRPEPDRPEPDRPEPDRPEPDRPEPDKPEPDRPEPDRPEPDRPEPDRPEPDRPEPDRPEPDKPEPDSPEPDRPEPDSPEPDRPEPDRPEPDRPEPDRPEPDRPEPDKPKPDDRPWGDDTDMIEEELRRRERFDYSNQNKPDIDQPRVEEPKMEQPRVEEPKADPGTDNRSWGDDTDMIEEELRRRERFDYSNQNKPDIDQPRVEEPKMEQPHVDEPKMEQPNIESSDIDNNIDNMDLNNVDVDIDKPEVDVPKPEQPNDVKYDDEMDKMIEDEIKRRNSFDYSNRNSSDY